MNDNGQWYLYIEYGDGTFILIPIPDYEIQYYTHKDMGELPTVDIRYLPPDYSLE